MQLATHVSQPRSLPAAIAGLDVVARLVIRLVVGLQRSQVPRFSHPLKLKFGLCDLMVVTH
jgi:hypothetical protein